jgi:septum formation topological specificity factor MinE
MKYIAILAIVVLIVRVDYWLGLFDKAKDSFNKNPVEVQSSDINSDRKIIPVAEDRSLKQTNKEKFFALLEDFRITPDASVRERAMAILKSHPTMFGQKVDKDLEALVYRWRDLLINNEKELSNFMLDLMENLQGENLQVIRKFFSVWMEINMQHFIAAYSRSKDSNCMIATTFGDNIPEEEKLNELYEREEALKAIVNKDNLDNAQRLLATNCLMVLNLEISRIAPPAYFPESNGVGP